ncbi:hypothetical protein [Corynebacterium auriscanis]|uniref:hypothetical protein n=1 Tax=Corynebacterium auriscanis TaxID=99807 RepID=UPI0022472C13|nr:hypothetical protein [Corynebacterium auriscanis]MCX2163632.1 hypothetical protein [Corynebacterium auriscanis]
MTKAMEESGLTHLSVKQTPQIVQSLLIERQPETITSARDNYVNHAFNMKSMRHQQP